eukprot:COSAG05_NODE_17843_length_318_cov_0.931507_1_plen_64_part_01
MSRLRTDADFVAMQSGSYQPRRRLGPRCSSVGLLCSVEAALFFKQKTAYVMESRDWSSDVCSSD